MLKLLDITKEYKIDEESLLALHGVSIEFRKNEFVSILGPSGCGKTTLLNIVGGLDRYTSGDIQVDGISTKEFDDVDWDTYRNRRIGFVFQSYNLIPHMSIMKNVAMALTLAGVSNDERKRRALEALRKVGLEKQARKKPNQLSGGQMQRVAIARALINNPEIILADEPTGALDSESGIQVMELLKEVAEDRLVIMVTHNPILAEQYSTRIVYLKDGQVDGDTKPFASGDEITESSQADEIQNLNDTVQTTEIENNNPKSKNKNKKQSRLALYRKKLREKQKSSMKLRTAISLSFNNLLSKKGRTILTSIAGSIGIIGIILVLALSTGVKAYVHTIEQNALSQYPIEIGEAGFDLTAALDMLNKKSDRPEFPDSDTIYTQPILGNIMSNLDVFGGENDLPALKKYLDNNFDSSLGQVKYDYGTKFNVFSKNTGEANDKYVKIHPFEDVMKDTMDELGGALDGMMGNLENYAVGIDAWDEMSDNQNLLNQQYDLLGNSRWPNEADEIIIVLDKQNQLNDYTLFSLGLLSPDGVVSAFADKDFAKNHTFTVDELLKIQYKVLTNADYLVQSEEDGYWNKMKDKEITDDFVLENSSVDLKVVGVVRPKKDAVVTSINSTVAYTSKLTELLIQKASEHPAVMEQIANYDNRVGDKFIPTVNYKIPDTTEEEAIAGNYLDVKYYNDLMRGLGLVDTENPSKIKIFCTTFESKDQIIKLLNQYKEDTGNKIIYTDFLSMIMGYVQTMTDTVTGALLGFSAISLLVSTIMIAIIIYTSVLERQKEIGVLRSLGARKKDISRVFIAESTMLGAYAGAIGLLFGGLISLVGNQVIQAVWHYSNIVQVRWWHCLMMMGISVLLSMLAGFVPSRIAANKDPAIALRSE